MPKFSESSGFRVQGLGYIGFRFRVQGFGLGWTVFVLALGRPGFTTFVGVERL